MFGAIGSAISSAIDWADDFFDSGVGKVVGTVATSAAKTFGSSSKGASGQGAYVDAANSMGLLSPMSGNYTDSGNGGSSGGGSDVAKADVAPMPNFGMELTREWAELLYRTQK